MSTQSIELRIDGLGNTLQELEMPAFTFKEDRFDDGDTGLRCRSTFADVNGDGRQELLAYNWTRLWHWVQD